MAKNVKILPLQVQDTIKHWSIKSTDALHDMLAIYLSLLMRWNKVMNLVGARNYKDCLNNLIIDSFYLAEFISSLPNAYDESNLQIWDLGAGAGLPGIPLRMIWAKGNYYLVEAREKRAIFMENTLDQLRSKGFAFHDTYVFQGRAQDFFAQQQEKSQHAHIILSRAFMPWAQLLVFVKPFLVKNGRVIFLTLEKAPTSQLEHLGWKLESEFKYLVNNQERYFWSVEYLEK